MTDPAPIPDAIRGRRVLFLDPVRQLAAHDDRLCRALAQLGCGVTLGSCDALEDAAAPYRHFAPYRDIATDGSRIARARQHAAATAKVLEHAEESQPESVILYCSLHPRADGNLIRALRRQAIRTIVVAHDVQPLGRARDPWRHYYRLYRSADRILTFSEFARQALIQRFGKSPSRVAIVRQPIEPRSWDDLPDRGDARRELGVADAAPLVVCPGRLHQHRGLETLLEAWPHVPEARLAVVGLGEATVVAELRTRARELGIEERVDVPGLAVNPCELSSWLRAADLFVQPDHDLYHCGLAMQAAAHGCGIVATRIGNTTEVLGERSAWLVDAGDAPALGKAIGEALDQPETRDARARAAHADVQTATWDEVVRSLGYMVM